MVQKTKRTASRSEIQERTIPAMASLLPFNGHLLFFILARLVKPSISEGIPAKTDKIRLSEDPFGGTMARLDKGGTVSLQELVVSSLTQTDALAKLLIEKGLITQDEFMQKLSAERAGYQVIIQQRIS